MNEQTVTRRWETGGQPVVMFHGLTCGVDNWGEFPDALAKLGRDVAAVDVKDGIGDHDTMADYARSAAEVIEALTTTARPVDVVGLSWGGLLAAALAVQRPELVRRLVLCSTPLAGQYGVAFNVMKELLSNDRSVEHLVEVASTLYGGDFKRDPELIREMGMARGTDVRSKQQQVNAAFWFGAHSYKLMGLKQPTLAMLGDDDPIVPYDYNSVATRYLIRDSRVVRVSGGGHLFPVSRPDWTAEIIDEFLREGNQ